MSPASNGPLLHSLADDFMLISAFWRPGDQPTVDRHFGRMCFDGSKLLFAINGLPVPQTHRVAVAGGLDHIRAALLERFV